MVRGHGGTVVKEHGDEAERRYRGTVGRGNGTFGAQWYGRTEAQGHGSMKNIVKTTQWYGCSAVRGTVVRGSVYAVRVLQKKTMTSG